MTTALTVHEAPTEPQYAVVEVPDIDLIAAADAAYQAKREEWAATDSTLRTLRAERDNLTDSCAACGRPFDNAEQVAEHRSELDARIHHLEGNLVLRQDEGEEARAKRDALHAAASAAQAAERENDRLRASYEQAQRDHQRRQEQVAAAAEALRIAEADHATAQQSVTTIEAAKPEDPTEREARIRDALDDERVALTAVQLRLAALNSTITSGEAHVARIDAELARAKERADAITAAQRRVVTLDVAAREMAAMKERLIARVIPELEQRASALVADLTDGKHSELRLTSDYEIQYVTETGGVRGFGSLSGGAQDLFALALRLAIAELRAGSVPFLVLDEVFESLDDDRQALAWAAIEHLGRRYAQVLVVTHVAALRERATTVVSV